MLNKQNIQQIKARYLRKLPVRYAPIVFAFFMSAIMAMLMCMVITAASGGVTSNYFLKVLHAYELAMPVAFVCVLTVRPLVVRLVVLCVTK